MPCWEENAIRLDFSNADQDLLEELLGKSYPEVRLERGKLYIPQGLAEKNPGIENEIRRAYAKAVVEEAAQIQGWAVSLEGEEQEYILER